MMLVVFFLYLIACAITGIMGRNTVFGFVGHFFLSIVITPFVDFLILAISRQSSRQKNV